MKNIKHNSQIKNKNKFRKYLFGILGVSFISVIPAMTITSCSKGSDNQSNQTPPNGSLPGQPQMTVATPPIVQESEDEKLSTKQPVILPADFPETSFTNYILSKSSEMTDQAQVDFTCSTIKDYLNKNLASEMGGSKIVKVSMKQDGNFSPIRYSVLLQFDKKPNKNIEGFNEYKDGTPFTYVSTTYYPTKIVSENLLSHQFQGFTQQALFYQKEVGTHPRKLNKEVYDTELMKKYEKDGFQYPGYNCNYELKESGNSAISNGYLTIPGTTNKLDLVDLVLKETPDTKTNDKGELPYPGGYADPAFIKEEINNKRFKKHPAASNFYSKNVQDETQAVDTQFTMSTAIRGPQALGLYAPAGEIITLQFSEEQLKLFKDSNASLEIQINENYWDAMDRTDASGMVSNRYPRVRSYFTLNSSTWDEMTAVNQYTYSFGTPFGGNISINFTSPVHNDKNSLSFGDPIQFTINNAVKSLSYFDGYTTLDDWNKQIKEVIAGTITSPNIAILSSLYSANIPFSNPLTHQCGTIFAKDFVYPQEVSKKWDNFLLLSNNFAGRYQGSSRTEILDMKFCDDIWGDAAAWGGGMVFYCPIEWGAGSFLSGGDPVNFNNWGTLHEINHNFQQDNAFFKAQSHPGTNIVNLFDMSVINNAGRYRSELNLNDNYIEPDWIKDPYHFAWNKLSSPFNVMRIIRQKIEQTKTNPKMDMTEYAWYAALLYTVGSYNFTEFANYNANNFPITSSNWTPIKYIEFMSDYFKTNMWNLCRITPRWSGVSEQPWPSENSLTNQEKQIIKGLNKYPAIDFIGNQYAAGQYMYNMDTKEFDYTTDVTTPFEIPAIQPYNFNFENYIVCDNENFVWDKLEFTPTSKCGGSLKLDPNNNKRLIYTPNPDAIDQIDEFNIKITPTKESLSKLPTNYVPGYAWKIKVRQNVNRPVVQSYVPVKWQNLPNDNFYNVLFDAMGLKGNESLDNQPKDGEFKVEPYSCNPVINMDGKVPNMALTLGDTSFCTYEFNYVVPKTGTYYMWTKYENENGIRILIDGKEVYQNITNKNSPTENKTHDYIVYDNALKWNKDEVHKIQVGIVNRTPDTWEYEKGYVDVKFTNQNVTTNGDKVDSKSGPQPGGTPYAFDNQVLVPWVTKKNTSLELMHNYLYSKEFQYKNREIDYHLYESTSRKMTSNYATSIDENLYNFIDPNQEKPAKINAPMLKNDSDYQISGPWFNVPNSTKFFVPSLINASFNQPQTLSGLEITLPTSEASKQFSPQYWQVQLTHKNGDVTTLPVGGNGSLPTNNIVINFDTPYNDITNIDLSIFYVSDTTSYIKVIINQVKFLSSPGNYVPNDKYSFQFTPIKRSKFYVLKYANSRYEDWSPTKGIIPNTDEKYNVVKTQVDFSSPQTINTILFARGNNHPDYFPNWYRFKFYKANGDVEELTAPNTKYSYYSYYLTLPKAYQDVTKIDIEMYRTFKNGGDGIVLDQIKFFSSRTDLDNAFGINDPSIKLSGKLSYESNNPQINYSNINGVYLKSQAQGDVIEFTLTHTEAFKILGRKDETDGSFDVYVNDKKVQTNVSCASNQREINVPILEYTNNNQDKVLRVKIVNTSNKPIYLNSILLYGEKTKLY